MKKEAQAEALNKQNGGGDKKRKRDEPSSRAAADQSPSAKKQKKSADVVKDTQQQQQQQMKKKPQQAKQQTENNSNKVNGKGKTSHSESAQQKPKATQQMPVRVRPRDPEDAELAYLESKLGLTKGGSKKRLESELAGDGLNGNPISPSCAVCVCACACADDIPFLPLGPLRRSVGGSVRLRRLR